MTERFVIEALRSEHQRAGFRCGVEALDHYFAQRVGQDTRRGVASCYVACTPTDLRVAGYYTISMSGASLDEFPAGAARTLPKYDLIPAALIGRLAVDCRYRGRGLGGVLLWNAVERAIGSDIAAHAAVVEAKDESAAGFYGRHGFAPLIGDRLRMFLPLSEAARRLELRR